VKNVNFLTKKVLSENYHVMYHVNCRLRDRLSCRSLDVLKCICKMEKELIHVIAKTSGISKKRQ